MSITVLKAEVRRFLSDPTPEVLCIKGKWGVGKTYSWRAFLRAAKNDGELALERYAYVSLFGLNSLEDLRYALFEKTVTGDNIGKDSDASTFEALIKDRNTSRKLKPILEFAAAFFNRKSMADLLAKSAFLTVRNQLICFDDLERAGAGLDTREVLGLATLLKDERNCKVVLLLNDEEHDQKEEFERQLEKVADITLRFEPSPEEAAEIALIDSSDTTELIMPRIVELGITNIRVIKRIERLVVRLLEVLKVDDRSIIGEAVATLVLASWAVQQPKLAPSLAFLRNYNSYSLGVRAEREPPDPDVERFRAILSNYPFRWANDLDRIIIDGAEAGYFVESALQQAAAQEAAERKKNSRDNDLSRTWSDLYHGSLATEDDVFLNSLHQSAIKDAAAISLVNINSAVRILRENSRDNHADEVIEAYIAVHDDEPHEFFNIASHHFSETDQIDEGLREAFAARRAAYNDPRDPLDVLRAMGARNGWNDSDAALMAKQSADDFERMFEALRGKEVASSIEMIRALGRSNHAESDAIEKASLEALKRIAAKSPLRAKKLLRFGIVLEPEPIPAAAEEVDNAADPPNPDS